LPRDDPAVACGNAITSGSCCRAARDSDKPHAGLASRDPGKSVDTAEDALGRSTAKLQLKIEFAMSLSPRAQ
jgi:hypothetical protein